MTKWIAYYGCGDDYYGYVEEEDRIIDESFVSFWMYVGHMLIILHFPAVEMLL